jgi:hypothetical protein
MAPPLPALDTPFGDGFWVLRYEMIPSNAYWMIVAAIWDFR